MASIPQYLFLIFVISISTYQFTNASSFLFLLPVASVSHHVFFRPLMEELASRGHQVTLISAFPKFEIENVTKIALNVFPKVAIAINEKVYDEYKERPFSFILELEKKLAPSFCEDIVQTQVIQDQIKNGLRYDIVFVNSAVDYCTYSIAALLTDKIIYLNQLRRLLPSIAYNLGIITPYSIAPHVMSHLATSMSFDERLWNALASITHVYYSRKFNEQDRIIQNVFPNAPNIENALSKTKLIFSNNDAVLGEPLPSMNNVIFIGGMQCKKAKPVSKEFQEVLSGKSGFILFSLGTVAKMKNSQQETVQAFIDAFAMLKENVIWKTEENYKNLSPNVKTFPWIPQNDILGHPNIRLFVTQGGVFSLHEALYHSVPILGTPILGDQYSNIKRIEDLEIGEKINIFSNLTADIIYTAIRNIIDDPKYKKSAVHYSAIFRDTNMTPLERAVFWTEWLTRHSDVDNVTRSYSQNLSICKYFMLDIIGVLVVVFFIPLTFVLILTKKIVKLIKTKIC